MVQVDVFWSYGIGAGFAYSAKKQLQQYQPKKEDGGWFANPYFTKNILYLATLFGPSGLYLLWQFTNWETMQALDKTMPAWLVVAFSITNVTQGMLGFWVTYRLIKSGKDYLAFLQPVLGYFAMFFILVHGWDGTGYQRFLSEDRTVFETWTPAHITTWLTSSVAITLAVMGLFLLPVMFAWMLRWATEGAHLAGLSKSAQASPREFLVLVLATIFGGVLGAAILASLLIHQLGALVGTLVFVAVAVVGIAGPKGYLHWFFGRIDSDVRLARQNARKPGSGELGHLAA